MLPAAPSSSRSRSEARSAASGSRNTPVSVVRMITSQKQAARRIMAPSRCARQTTSATSAPMAMRRGDERRHQLPHRRRHLRGAVGQITGGSRRPSASATSATMKTTGKTSGSTKIDFYRPRLVAQVHGEQDHAEEAGGGQHGSATRSARRACAARSASSAPTSAASATKPGRGRARSSYEIEEGEEEDPDGVEELPEQRHHRQRGEASARARTATRTTPARTCSPCQPVAAKKVEAAWSAPKPTP